MYPDPNQDSGTLGQGSYPDRHQNLIDWSLGHGLPLQKISSKTRDWKTRDHQKYSGGKIPQDSELAMAVTHAMKLRK